MDYTKETVPTLEQMLKERDLLTTPFDYNKLLYLLCESVPTLKQMCKQRKIRRYSKKTKNQLIVALREYDEGIIYA